MQENEQIVFQFIDEKEEVKRVTFDQKILNFKVDYLSNNHNQPYPLPKNIVHSERPFQIMRDFMIAHQYNPNSVKVVKPIRSSNYSQVVDPITYKLFQKYCDEKMSEQVAEVVALSRFLRFHQLTEAISAAVAVNYFIGEEDRALEEFIRGNGLQDVGSQQICEIMKVYQQQFRLLELRAKQEMKKVADNEQAES